MLGIILTGHGGFASGMEKAMRQILGEQTQFIAIDFPETSTTARLTEQLEQAGVTIAVYGHLHGEANRNAFEGERNGIVYHCVAADKLDFTPKRIL